MKKFFDFGVIQKCKAIIEMKKLFDRVKNQNGKFTLKAGPYI